MEQNKDPDPKTESAGDVVRYWAAQGLSTRSIAAKCGMTHDDFLDRLEFVERGIKPLRMIYEHARALYEAERRITKNDILATTESEKLKFDIIKHDLLEMKEPGSGTSVSVENPDAYNGYEITIRPKQVDVPKEEE